MFHHPLDASPTSAMKHYPNPPGYNSWHHIMSRCYNKRDPKYPIYGGRGITVCKEWRASYKTFWADMGEKPEGYTLERIDNDGNYEPSNCKWATWEEQRFNRRVVRKLTINGVTKAVYQWADHFGISRKTVRNRVDRCGWSDEDAVQVPVTPGGW